MHPLFVSGFSFYKSREGAELGDVGHWIGGKNQGPHWTEIVTTPSCLTNENVSLFIGIFALCRSSEMLGSCIAVAVLAILFEGLKVGRELVDKRMRGRSVAAVSACDCELPDTESQVTEDSGKAIKRSENRLASFK